MTLSRNGALAGVAHSDFFRSRLRARSSARRSLAVRLPMPDLEILSSTGSIDS